MLFVKMQLRQNVASSLPEKGQRGSHTRLINRLAGAFPCHCKSGIPAISTGTSTKSMANKREPRLSHTEEVRNW